MLNCLLQSIQPFGKCLIIFCMFHDQSAVEPWFNTNADMVADNRYDYSLMALHLVHDHMRRGGRCAVVITIAQLHLTKPELRFCTGSNPARGVSEIRDGEDFWQLSRLEIGLNAFLRSTIPQKQFIHRHLWSGPSWYENS